MKPKCDIEDSYKSLGLRLIEIVYVNSVKISLHKSVKTAFKKKQFGWVYSNKVNNLKRKKLKQNFQNVT